MEKETILENAPIVAFCVVKGLNVTPFRKADGRIAFLIRGDVASTLDCMYQNEPVGITDYMRALGSVRNAIFTLKSVNS